MAYHSLATVNFFLFCVGSTQVARVMLWRRSQGDLPSADDIKDGAKEQGKAVEGALKDTVDSAKKAIGK